MTSLVTPGGACDRQAIMRGRLAPSFERPNIAASPALTKLAEAEA